MKGEESQRIVIITFCISLLFVLVQVLIGSELLSFSGIKAAFSATLVLSAWWWFYFNYGWKIKLFNLILYKENINGTWFGNYESKDLEKGTIYKGEICLVIKQNFLNIKITSITNRFKSYSYSEELNCKDEKKQLIYVYSQDEISSDDHNIRKGTSELELTKFEGKSELYGKFWTNTGTIGSLTFTQISNKHIMFFDKAKKIFEESEVK
ncbi:hypothetical protein [Bacillus sp. FJAT-27251]|uniref:Cap15 family cyclic dinucleotide receptor domain-containing protein n=1 Tax=Bacillus sp. FJAT-27251 TaxID=1684142 RepID=UPI0006A7C206|nr:hypothetical protein [Bacillus sp. FJAT-27251]